MTAEKEQSSHIPIRFVEDNESEPEAGYQAEEPDSGVIELNDTEDNLNDSFSDFVEATDSASRADEALIGGPDLAELIASRAELKRLQTELAEAKDSSARRQADFENYRKRIERDRVETHNRIVADLARKLLPVLDNLSRALEAERTVENRESKEFRHFLHGIELISRQLNDVLESFGISPIEAVGQQFDPHIHEAVVTEPSDEYEPDTVIEEIARGYKIGDRLLRPSMVKVAARKD
ncbi:MAG TPA: nucleotide exchange factor GrpE [Pyrinomonadaceae bacterium]|jgi:molecular chaperone GrpE|nr:nucleotide exchange factor GrpE [Pyrinomonadaceae bacterium]